MPDVLLATVAALKADTGVQAQLTASRAPTPGIFAAELPTVDDAYPFMPTRAAVVKAHGGPKDLAPLQISNTRMIIQSYGETMHLAYVLDFACYLALKWLGPFRWVGPSVLAPTYIHSWIRQAGPVQGRDPTTQWAYQTSIWEVKASDLPAV